jgi:methionine aminopeptidase
MVQKLASTTYAITDIFFTLADGSVYRQPAKHKQLILRDMDEVEIAMGLHVIKMSADPSHTINITVVSKHVFPPLLLAV